MTHSQTSAIAAFESHLASPWFPCLAAQTATRRHLVTHVFAGSMACPAHDAETARAIAAFAGKDKPEHALHSLVVHFNDASPMPEPLFERWLFARLQGIHEADAAHHAWDPGVSDDPDDPAFSMSVGGKAFYVVGLHPGASRRARRLSHPALVFNLHAQFEYLRSQGRYERLKKAIVERDIAFNGSANPMLAVHGTSSEARQYSGRHIVGEWQCPFRPRGTDAT
ncbi:guanitoxin biosynthesis heme-dependent pre-guanitoxin N-hydroxylase GntA [Luteibacter sp. PPL201]|uniref:Guanitoxin biosynthesis heme-dependent pre-guanitoxin N-hydroxylase GntA n=1 Tax=Luteibacter sahnii TaxID=3021977 RepID=A0ABT6BBV3_9GAMM